MKKIAFLAAVAITGLMATEAQAIDVGVTTSRAYSSAIDRNTLGLTIGQKFGSLGATAGVSRTTVGSNDQDRYSLMASYDIAKMGPVTLSAEGGAAYLHNQVGDNGYAAVFGAGVSVPVAKKVSLGIDLTHQIGQTRVEQFNGNILTASVKYSF